MSVSVHWRKLTGGHDSAWHLFRCLYAYTTVGSDEILYIGKADRATIHERWKADDKQKFFKDLENQRRIYQHIVLFGELELAPRQNFSWQLLSDVESLLIACEQPWGNIQSRRSRISRPGLVVDCTGAWIGKSRIYLDQ